MKIAIIFIFAAVFFLFIGGLPAACLYRSTSDVIYLRRHRRLMKGVFYLAFVGVLAVETAIRLHYISVAAYWFFRLHLVFALPFFISSAVLVFWKNGLRSRNFHKKLGYFCFAAFVGTLATGLILLVA